ncbi:DUF1642 domain-containing protein [Listeria monocytogenes]|nr:DUF1642 domain-containing protein [Listeria monocytogenes]
MNNKEFINALKLRRRFALSLSAPFNEGYRGGINFALDLAMKIAEPKKVVVPEFVAGYLENRKEKYAIGGLGAAINTAVYERSDLEEWMNNNVELFARAWLDGYEVEKEQLYYVKMPVITWNDDSSELETEHAYLILDVTSDETRLSHSNKDYGHWKARLTEVDIKSIDERYWPFAVKVED